MIQEVLVLHVGAAIAKAVLKLWLGDSGIGVFGNTTIDIISKLGIELSTRRQLERDFHQLADRVGENLLPFFESEGAKLDESSQQAIALALANSISDTNLDPIALVTSFDLRANKLAAALIQAAKSDLNHFSSDETALFERLATECASYIIEISTRLPTFSPAVFGELLQRQNNIYDIALEVLDEIRKLKETSTVYNDEEEFARFERRYRLALSHRNDEVELFGLDAPSKIRRQNLSVAYVSLSMMKRSSAKQRLRNELFHGPAVEFRRVTASTPIKAGTVTRKFFIDSGALASGLKTMSMFARTWLALAGGGVSCDAIIATSPRLLIRGEAGSGKTTLLQWIAVSISSQRLQDSLSEFNVLVPFFMKLRDYAERSLPSPVELVQRAVPEIADSMPANWADYLLSGGRAIILIDGIDELDSVKRDAVREWIRGLTNSYDKCRYVLTCRPTAVEENWLATSAFEEAELLPMGWKDIDNLVDHWHTAMGSQASVPESQPELINIATHLKRQLRQSRALSELATSPLLCAMLCALYYEKRQQLPSNRIALYEAAIKMLLDQRDRARGIAGLSLPHLNQEQKRAFLEQLAYWMLRNNFTTTTLDEASAELARVIPLVKGMPEDATPTNIMDLLVERSGIIRSPAEGYIDFIHKTFQEFLGAQAIVDAADLNFLAEAAHEDKWYETAVLAAGLAPLAQRELFLRALITRGQKSPQDRQKLFLLAVACLETAVKLSSEVEAIIDKSIREVIPPRSMTEANSLKAAGSLAVPRLGRRSSFSAREAAASVRALSQIGGDDALRVLETYGTDSRKTVVRELVSAWNHFDDHEYARRVLANSPLDEGSLTLQSADRIGVLFELKRLKRLAITNCGALKSVEVIGRLTNLEELTLLDAKLLQSIGPLGLLHLLEKLILTNADLIADVDFTEHLPELRYLAIYGAQAMKSIKAIETLNKLETFHLSEASFLIGSDWKLPPSVKVVRLLGPLVTDCRLFSSAVGLDILVFSATGDAVNLDIVGNLTALRSLNAALPKADNLGFLASLKNVTRLSLRNLTNVKSVDDVYKMERLSFVELSGANFIDLEKLLEGKTLLDEVVIEDCVSTAIFPDLSKMEKLRELTLSNVRGLKDITNMAKLPNIKVIRIVQCPDLSDLAPLSGIKAWKLIRQEAQPFAEHIALS